MLAIQTKVRNGSYFSHILYIFPKLTIEPSPSLIILKENRLQKDSTDFLFDNFGGWY